MANKKISELNNIITINDEDILPIVDTSENETKKISIQQMKETTSPEYGSNLNGKWIKYANGTMICYKTLIGTANINESTMGGTFYFTNIDLGNTPQEFIERPTIVVSPQTQSGTQFFLMGSSGSSYGTATNFGVVSIARPQQRNDVLYVLDVVAIGRWK